MVAKANDAVGKGRTSTDVLLADIVHIDTVGEKASDKAKVGLECGGTSPLFV